MNKRATPVIVIISVAIIIIIFAAVLILPGIGSNKDVIELPGPSSEPDTEATPGGSDDPGSPNQPSSVVTTQNVLQIIAVMSRSDNYYQNLNISLSSNKAQTVETWYHDGKIRAVFDKNKERKNIIIDNEEIYIWYDGDTTAYSGPLGDDFTADDELNLPTYEDLLQTESSHLTDAGYATLKDLGEICVYVESSMGDGVFDRYWISCDTGLLVKYEKEAGGSITYSMVQTAVESPITSNETFITAFTLPDGSTLS